MNNPPAPRERSGVIPVFLAAVFYSLGGLCMKLIPWSGIALNSGRSLLAVLLYTLYFVLTRHRPRMNRWIALGALAVCGTNVLFAVANKMTTAANAIVLQYTAPIFVIVLSALFLKKRPERMDVAACVLVFLGVVCFFVEGLGGGDLAGDTVALISGVCYGGVFLLNDLPDGSPMDSVFWGGVLGALIGLPFLPGQPALDAVARISLVILGVFQMGTAFILLTVGLRTTPPVTASLITGIEPVLNPILVAVFYGETMGTLSLIGAAIVVGTVAVYNVRLARRPQQEKSGEKASQSL